MIVKSNTWQKFDDFCLTKLQYQPSTLEERKRKLRHLQRNFIDLINFNPDQIYGYFAKRIKQGTKPHSLNHYINALNAWLKFLDIDFHFDRYKPQYKPIKVPTSKEIGLLLKKCSRSKRDKRLKTIIFLFAHSGLRAAELCGLKLKNIDWNRNTLTVLGKGGKIREVPVKEYVLKSRRCPSILNYIKFHRIKTHKKNVFTSTKGPLVPGVMRADFRRIAKKAGVAWIHPHSLRHYYATMLLRNGVNVRIVQELLGHSDLRTTTRYLHNLKGDVHQAINKVDFDKILYQKQNNEMLGDWSPLVTGEYPDGPARICNNLTWMPGQSHPSPGQWLTPRGGEIYFKQWN